MPYRGGCTIPLFQLSVWCEKFVAAQHYAVIWKQLLFANKRNRVRWVVLGLSQEGACTHLFENFSENSLKGDLSNDTTVIPPLFSLVNTFKKCFLAFCYEVLQNVLILPFQSFPTKTKHYGYQNKSLILKTLKNLSALGASEFSPSSFWTLCKSFGPSNLKVIFIPTFLADSKYVSNSVFFYTHIEIIVNFLRCHIDKFYKLNRQTHKKGL